MQQLKTKLIFCKHTSIWSYCSCQKTLILGRFLCFGCPGGLARSIDNGPFYMCIYSDGQKGKLVRVIWYLYIRIKDIMQYQSLSSKKAITGQCFSGFCLAALSSVVLKMGHYTRAFTLVAKLDIPPQWHLGNFFIAFLHVTDHFQHFVLFSMVSPLEWWICDISLERHICHSIE